jgi:hypothetical protein
LERSKAAGFKVHLSKPVELDKLEKVLGKFTSAEKYIQKN